jgi:hypothetical protein
MKWEYLLTTFNTKREWVVDELNRLGEEEWDAVATMDDGLHFDEAAKTRSIGRKL